MKLYLIGGLGADERVFQFLDLEISTEIINWIEPLGNETLASYANRLRKQIDTKQDFGILGVSFGGIVAIELSKLFTPELLLLVSSIETSKQLPSKYIMIGRTGLINLIPKFLIKPPQFLMNFLFGAKNKELLKQIIRDTDPNFIKWALNKITNWKNISN